MAPLLDPQIWGKILAAFEDKLQYGFITQAAKIREMSFEGGVLTLTTAGDEATAFFSAEVNQQRFIIMSRGILPISSVVVIQGEELPT